ncbi:ATP synthase F0 subunit C [Thermodesulfobium sp.]|jgi:F-type H+-transporting ATPase subunit c|uniref:ATP synthase subunit c n=1 Tax=Thermodesulfobium narugense TaxID=184064 RepID=A0A7C5PHZ5_9BACT
MDVVSINLGLAQLGAGVAIGFAAAGGGAGMGILGGYFLTALARQPELLGPLRTYMILVLVFIEAQVLYGFVVSMILLFAAPKH